MFVCVPSHTPPCPAHTVIYSDSTYHITIDQIPFLKGNLLEDLTPPINPLVEIEDPDDKMPAEWDEREE